MDLMQLSQTLFQVVLIPTIIILGRYVIKFIQIKCADLTAKTDNDLYDKYILMLQDTVINCVLATTQTYVENMKNKNAFDKEAQEKAFQMTFDAVMDVLSEEAKEYLQSVLGDLDLFVTNLIEAQVQSNKK